MIKNDTRPNNNWVLIEIKVFEFATLWELWKHCERRLTLNENGYRSFLGKKTLIIVNEIIEFIAIIQIYSK